MSRCTVASSPSVVSPTGLLAREKKMPGELFCIKTALHKRREKTSCSVCFSLFFFFNSPEEVPTVKDWKTQWKCTVRGSRCCIIPLGSSLRGVPHPSQKSHRNTVTNCAQEMPIHLQSDIYTLLLYSFVISGPVVLIILIMKDIMLIFFLMGQNTHKYFIKMPAHYARHCVFLLC